MKFVPRSAVFGPGAADSPVAQQQHLQVGPPPRAQPFQADVHQVELLKGEVVRLRQQRDALVKEANTRLATQANRIRQLEGFIRQRIGPMRVGYTSQPQTPGRPPVSVGVPTHAMRNPNVEMVNGGARAPVAVPMAPAAGNPHDSAGPANDAARSAHETVRMAEDALFYGQGDSAFYEGEGD